ncbi:hypothetical protein C7N43_33575 [Sphingobacteriales bacterium UPWRP_1]|nr:hypothetical protein B6N25_01110 [Sphingobacteriales bacterium TSM_CSS]PSJ72573.1 hypothetical protein C7N43_33575 [Sphingobacteriales bacterium UPWRP_1]
MNELKTQAVAMLCFVWLIGLLSGCASGRISKNVAYLYSGKSVIPEVKIKTHYIGNDTVAVYMGIATNAITFDQNQTTRFGVLLRLYYNKNGKTDELADSAYLLLTAVKSETAYTILTHNMHVAPGNNYLLQAYAVEESNRKGYRGEAGIWRKTPYNEQDEQNYLLTNAATDEVLFDAYNKQGTQLRVNYRNQTYANFTVQYFLPVPYMAPPPFTPLKEAPLPAKPDSVFTTTAYLTLNRQGMYFIRADTNKLAGIAIVCTDAAYPKLTTASDLIEALRYITRNEEYTQMLNADNPKAAVDDFWLTRAGSADRGRILIKEYYGRVQRANQFFTTFREGWKTDRGIIYIVYGIPDALYKLPDAETWVYYIKGSQNKLQFDFQRQDLPFTNQNYRLIRDLYYESSWQNAVYEWRNGIITNTNAE